MRFCHPFALTLSLCIAGCPGCPDDSKAPADVVVATARDAAPPTKRGPRRRRARVRSGASAQRNANGAVANTGATEAPVDDTVVDEEAPRPRITETGPMLPEDLGPPPEVTYDMGAGGEGPMGLDEAQVSRGFDPLMGRLGNCAAATTDERGRGPHGRVSVRMRIRNDGRPVAARVSGGGGGADFVTCVRRVVASARFPRFRGPDVIVGWGFDVD